MSSGQIRDYIDADDVAKKLLELVDNPHASGIYNCGSGIPRSLREFAEAHLAEANSSIVIVLGAYPDRIDEPLAFWADTSKFTSLIS